MNIEEKYKLFGLDSEMTERLHGYSVKICEPENKPSVFTVKTVVIERVKNTFESKEECNAKLV